jgi:two-component system NtrC family response regulator
VNNEQTYDQHPPDREYGPTVLIVDDEMHARERLEMALAEVDDASRIHILHATSVKAALTILSGTPVHVVLLDKNLAPEPTPTEENGIEAIPEMLRLQPQLQILMVTGSKDIQDVVRAMNLGACGYITKEMPNELLIAHIDRAIQVSVLKIDKARRDRCQVPDESSLGGKSGVFQDILRRAEVLSESSRPVLILGESGTGKTALAKWIHARRGRFLKQQDRPFFAVNVSTLAKNLIESELFGHEKGSFTDARETKQGLFELANNGTLFLDEIGELPLDLQPKFLTVIEEGTFLRVGGKKPLHFKPKLIFATNRNLQQMVKEGKFRKDLFMRISMFPIQMPSLSERKEDIPEIIRAILPQACRDNQVQVEFEDLPKDFIDHLMNSPIEGNVRGIQHQLDRLLVLSPRDKKGRPVLTRWRSVPGLCQESMVAEGLPLDHEKASITYQELMARTWNMIGPDFPGLNEFLDDAKARLLAEANAKFKTGREMSRIFRISESTASLMLRRYGEPRRGQSAEAQDKRGEEFVQ